MSISKNIIEFCSKYHEEKGKHPITDDYYYFIYPYSLYVKSKIESIINKFDLLLFVNTNQIIDDLVYQIIAYSKPNIFNYIIKYEFELSCNEELVIGKSEKEKHAQFVIELSNTQEWIEYLFEKYPVLEKILNIFTSNCCRYIEEILYNLKKDFHELKTIGIPDKTLLLKIKLFSGDLHNQGKCVAILHFNNQTKIVYKPRSGCNEKALLDFREYLIKKGFSILLGIPQFINKKNHTWYEFINPEHGLNSQEELPGYYNNLGKLVCMFYILGTSDIIPDNVISSNGVPYIIDIEAIMGRPKAFKIYPQINSHFEMSVIKVGILPNWMITNINERNRISSVLFPFKRNEKDEMGHLPQCDRRNYPITFELLSNFTEGFQDAYNFFTINKEIISNEIDGISSLKNTINRVILHPTSFYELLFREFTLPESLHGTSSIDKLLKKIITKELFEDLGDPDKVIESIINQLYNCDIPFFFVNNNEKVLFDGFGNTVLDQFNFNSFDGIELIKQRLKNLSSENLSMQIKIIETSINCAFEAFHLSSHKRFITLPSNYSYSDDYIETATIIGENLFKSMIQIGNEVNWIGKNRNALDGRYETMPMNQDLYDGNIGIALFFIYLSKFTNENKYIDISIKLFKLLRDQFYQLININYYRNLSTHIKEYASLTPYSYPLSLLYLMEHLPLECYDLKLKMDILNSLKHLLTFTKKYDYFSGIAGLLDFLLNYEDCFSSKQIQNIVSLAKNKLSKNAERRNNSASWPFFDPFDKFRKMELGGFAHGSAGNAYVLNKLYEKTSDEEILSLARFALNHDRSFYDDTIKGWKDGRSMTHNYDGGSWCHGSSGIALSRLLLMNTQLSDHLFESELITASEKIKQSIGHNQCICHGDMGNLEILFAIGRYIHDDKMTSFVLQTLNSIAGQIHSGMEIRCGDDGVVGLDGLFMGIAGVGYQFLRFAEWDLTPSVLCLELKNNLHKEIH